MYEWSHCMYVVLTGSYNGHCVLPSRYLLLRTYSVTENSVARYIPYVCMYVFIYT